MELSTDFSNWLDVTLDELDPCMALLVEAYKFYKFREPEGVEVLRPRRT